jgi:hypothetical protein
MKMFGEARRRHHFALFLVPLLAAITCSVACKKDEPAPEVSPLERVAPSPVGTTQDILDKTFNLKKSATFSFEIPPHAVRPHLHGIFESYIRGAPGVSDDTADIDFMIQNEEQQADTLANRPSEALLSVEGSHNQAVNLDLPASLDQPVKYYLVFRSSDGGKSSKVVRASFRIDF